MVKENIGARQWMEVGLMINEQVMWIYDSEWVEKCVLKDLILQVVMR